MPRNSCRNQEFVDLVSDEENEAADECQNKRLQTRRGPEAKTSRSYRNAFPSFQLPPNKRSNRIASSRRHKINKDKLDTEIFELCMEDIWTCIDQKRKRDYACLDSLWFNMYTNGNNKSNVLKWIKAKKIFSRRYVFVPIIAWGHWNLLVLCNFGKKNYLGTKKGPRMLLLDSLKRTNPARLRPSIKRFVVDILESEERDDIEQFRDQVELEFPQVPQQSGGDDSGIYTLYFIYCFFVIGGLDKDLSKLDAMFCPEELKNVEGIRKDIQSYREKRDAKTAE